jgi:hypothetical protein
MTARRTRAHPRKSQRRGDKGARGAQKCQGSHAHLPMRANQHASARPRRPSANASLQGAHHGHSARKQRQSAGAAVESCMRGRCGRVDARPLANPPRARPVSASSRLQWLIKMYEIDLMCPKGGGGGRGKPLTIFLRQHAMGGWKPQTRDRPEAAGHLIIATTRYLPRGQGPPRA